MCARYVEVVARLECPSAAWITLTGTPSARQLGRAGVPEHVGMNALVDRRVRAGVRAVPLPDSVAAELERHFKATAYTADRNRVFCNPNTGNALDHSALSRRFRAALKAAKRSRRPASIWSRSRRGWATRTLRRR
jgi:hypothetical protein